MLIIKTDYTHIYMNYSIRLKTKNLLPENSL